MAVLEPDVGIVVAYGRILPGALLKIPRHGFINVHGSLLPKYRGAAPIQRAIEAGEKITGVSIMAVEEELDSGPVYAIEEIPIGADERLPSISEKLAERGARALARVLREMPEPVRQDHSAATFAPKIEKEEGLITFREPATVMYNRFRAFDPWPGIFFETSKETIKVADMRIDGSVERAEPRGILSIDHDVTIGCGEGVVRLIELQRPGKPRAAAGDIARGLGWRAGAPLP
jgi:methionyl-tRNA formyltransferase